MALLFYCSLFNDVFAEVSSHCSLFNAAVAEESINVPMHFCILDFKLCLHEHV